MKSLPLILSWLALGLIGCSTLKSSPNRFVVEKRWVRGTVDGDYLLGRRIHRFAPIVTDKMVSAANSIDGLTA